MNIFQNTIAVEAYTREACMIDAFGKTRFLYQSSEAQRTVVKRILKLNVNVNSCKLRLYVVECVLHVCHACLYVDCKGKVC